MAQSGSDCGSGDAPAESGDKECVKHHIRHPCRYGSRQTELGLFRRDQKALEQVLKHERYGEADADPTVQDAVGKHGVRGTEKTGNRLHKGDPDGGENGTDDDRQPDHHGEIAIGKLPFSLTENAGDERGSAGTDHKAYAADDHDKRHNEIDGGKRGFSDEIGHEQSVHDAVNGDEEHHNDGRQREPEQLPIRKVIGKLDGIFGHMRSFLWYRNGKSVQRLLYDIGWNLSREEAEFPRFLLQFVKDTQHKETRKWNDMETQSARNAGTYVFAAHGVRIYKNTSISNGNVRCYCIVKIAPAPVNKKF